MSASSDALRDLLRLRPTQVRLVDILAAASAPVSGRAFARWLGISPTSAIASLKRLEKAGIVTREEVGKAHLWRLDVTNPAVLDWKAAYVARRRGVLLGLIREHSWTKYGKVLLCAQDVWADVKASVPPAPPRMPWEVDLDLFGIQVNVIDSYEPGRWRVVRHDHCQVIGGETQEQAMLVTHEGCTVLATSDTV